MKRCVVAGHICLDLIPEIDHAFDLVPGRLYEVGPAMMATGGAVSNTGVALHLLGVPSTLMGKIGDDAFGAAVRTVLRGYGAELDRGLVVAPGGITSYTVVVNIPGRDRTFLHCPGANHTFGAEDVAPAGLAGAALFHFGYPPIMARTYADGGRELEAIFRKAKDAGLSTSLDLVMPDPSGPSGRADWQAVLARTLPLTDVFLPSADELLFMLDRDHFGAGDRLAAPALSALTERLLGMGVAIAGLKLGSRGLFLRTGSAARLAAMGAAAPADCAAWAGRELWFPVFSIPKFVGATGAGDTTIAGFFAAFLRGQDPVGCGRFANAVGSCNVQTADALSGIKSWEETQALLDRGWATDPLTLSEAPGWRRDAATGVWFGPRDAGRG